MNTMKRIFCGVFLAITIACSAFGGGLVLREDTASQTRQIGPFVDDTGAPVTGLTIDAADVRLSKQGGDIVAKNSGGCTHDELGMYACTFDATDSSTPGSLQIIVVETGALPVYHEWQVLEEVVYDRDFPASATGIIGTAQTGDSFARLGPPAGASHAADNAAIKSDTAAILVDTGTSGVLVSSGTGSGQISLSSGLLAWNPAWDAEVESENVDALVSQHLDHIFATTYDPASKPGAADALFNELVESDGGVARFTANALEQGPAGGGGDPSIQSTTVASVTSQTILVPAATPTFADQINGWAVYIEDAGDADAYHLTTVTDYDQSNGQVTIAEAAPFTVAASDTMVFLPAFMDLGVDVTAWNGTALATTNPLPNAAPASSGGLPTVDASNRVTSLISSGTGSGQLSVSSGLLAWNPAWDAEVQSEAADAINADTGDSFTAVPYNAAWDAQIESEVADALAAIHLDHLLATDYDPASKPGVATALLNELVESDAGVSRFTANALEQGPAGGGGSTNVTQIEGVDATDVIDARIAAAALASQASVDAVDDLVDDLETRLTATRAGYLDNLSAGAVATQASVDAVDNFVDTEVAQIITLLGTPAGASISADIAALKVVADAVKAKTDNLTFGVTNQLNVNVESMNAVEVCGSGVAETDPWDGC